MKRPDVPVLTTLRFPAAFAIMLFHFFSLTSCPQWLWEGGAKGVSFFYVLSGFILYYNYSNLTDRGSFWVARFARIWPTHLVTFLMVFCLLPFSFLLGHASWPITIPANLLLVQAWLPFTGSAFSFNGVSWSISVEAFFYFSFPWLLNVLHKRGNLVFLLATFALGASFISLLNYYSPTTANLCGGCNPLGRLFEFALGMFTCRIWLPYAGPKPQSVVWSGYEILAIVLSLVLATGLPLLLHAWQADNAIAQWLATDFCAVAFAALIWVFAHQAGVISKLFSAPFFTWFGEISFAVYMCHQILLRWLILPDGLILSFNKACWIFPIYLFLSLIVASLLFYLVETPARRAIVAAYRRRMTLRHRTA